MIKVKNLTTGEVIVVHNIKVNRSTGAVQVEHQETLTLLVETETREATVTSSLMTWRTQMVTLEWTTRATTALS